MVQIYDSITIGIVTAQNVFVSLFKKKTYNRIAEPISLNTIQHKGKSNGDKPSLRTTTYKH